MKNTILALTIALATLAPAHALPPTDDDTMGFIVSDAWANQIYSEACTDLRRGHRANRVAMRVFINLANMSNKFYDRAMLSENENRIMNLAKANCSPATRSPYQ